MNLEHQDPRDQALAKRIIELKPDGCTCPIEFEETGMTGHISVRRDDDFRCEIHYPMTSTTLKAKGNR